MAENDDGGGKRSRSVRSDAPVKLRAHPTARKSSDGPTVRKNSDERWPEILGVATRIFAERGYSATSLQAIADDLGILKGSLYYYIRTKDDLLYEIIRTVYWEGVANFRRLSSGDGSASERLAAAITGHVKYLIDNLAETTVYLHEFERLAPGRQQELSAVAYDDLVRDLIAEGQADGSFREDVDPSLVAMAILGATNWVYRWYQPSGPSNATQIGSQFAELFIAGLASR